MPRGLALGLVLAVCGAPGCRHEIAFNDADSSWHYAIDAPRNEAASLVTVVSEKTLEGHSFAHFGFGNLQASRQGWKVFLAHSSQQAT